MDNEQLMSFKIEDNKLKMEISIDDLVYLFHTSPRNYNGEDSLAKIQEDKKEDFVKFIIDYLKDPEDADSDNIRWGELFEECFEEITCGDEPFCKFINWEEDENDNGDINIS